MYFTEAKCIADRIKKELRFDKTKQFKIYQTGSIAREEEKIKDIDFLIVTNRFIENLLESLYFTKQSEILITNVYACGSRRCSIKLKIDSRLLKIDLFYALKCNLPFALLAWEGPRIYEIRLRRKAKLMGYLLNQYGLYHIDTNERVRHKFKTVADIQKFLNVTVRLPYQRR